jgi:CMP-N,N'-diacetyllegionaminic acid synthase
MKVLGLIPARGGSKGVPRKNVRLLGGKPLLVYSAESALQAKSLAKVVLSTDDEEIAEIGRQCGLEVPFLRPLELAQDNTPTLPVIQHALECLEQRGEKFDALCLLQPTNPLRRAEDIDNCVELLREAEADSVVSVLPVPHQYNPMWVYWRDKAGRICLSSGDAEPISRRQDLPAAYHRDGSVYVTRTSVITAQNSLYGLNVRGYVMNEAFSANIDSEEDWQAVEKRIGG